MNWKSVQNSEMRALLLVGILTATATVSSLMAQSPEFATVDVVPSGTTLTTLYEFTGGPDGDFPEASVTVGKGGQLFGTTFSGGTAGWGAIFEVIPPAKGSTTWTEKILYSFCSQANCADGANPAADLYINSNGVLYGTTYNGGTAGYGTVFSLVPSTSGTWTEAVIHSFSGPDGASPAAGLVSPKTGILYGTTYNGGSTGYGTAFQLVNNAGKWTENVLYNFCSQSGCADGANPTTGLTAATSGVLYGTTFGGGTATQGTIFELLPPTAQGAKWTEKVLYSFQGTTDGANPQTPMILGNKNVLYGATFWAGSSTGCPLGGFPAGCGTVYELLPPSAQGGKWTQKVLYTFTGSGTDGAHPSQSLALATGGSIYGTTFSGGSTADNCFTASFPGCGTVFVLAPPTTQGGNWTKGGLFIFSEATGGGPNGLSAPSTGNYYYGTTYLGGPAGGSHGTVFQMVP